MLLFRRSTDHMKNKSKLIAVAAAAVMLFTGCIQTIKPQTPDDGYIINQLTAEEMQEDLDRLVEDIDTKHINPYTNVSAEEFRLAAEEISAKLPEITSEQFFFELRRLTALIGDSHTGVNTSTARSENLSVLPFTAERFSDGWYITSADLSCSGIVGARLEAINGFTPEQLTERLSPYIPHDNDAWLTGSVVRMLNIADYLSDAGIITNGTAELSINLDGEEQNVKINTVRRSAVNKSSFVSTERTEPITAVQDENYISIEDGGMLYIQYNLCEESRRKSIKKFVEELTPQLEGKAAVTVDLRNNSGGNSLVFQPVIKLLADFDGEVYVLVGEDTFSSAILNAVDLKNDAGAVLVGEPTGGSANHFGEIKSDVLRNSGVLLFYSTKYFENYPSEGVASLMPDVVSGQSFSDYLSGTDTQYETVRSLVKE